MQNTLFAYGVVLTVALPKWVLTLIESFYSQFQRVREFSGNISKKIYVKFSESLPLGPVCDKWTKLQCYTHWQSG